MTHSEKVNAYQAFFMKSEAGQEFISEIIRLIASNHEEAEKQPELSRDYVQRAKGVREVKNHIDSLMAGVKKGK